MSLRHPVSLLLLLAPTLALAHDDDPKVLDTTPPYRGPGLRASQAGGGSAAAGGFPSLGVDLRSWLSLEDLDGSSGGNDCWGYVSPAGREYALMGTRESTVFVEITDPDDAQVVAVRPGPSSLWRDVKTYQGHAYAVSEGGGGVQVFDLGAIDAGVVTQLASASGPGTGATHNVAIDEDSGYLYRCGGGDNGLRIFSLANPASPQYVGSWNERYVHDAQVVTMTDGPLAGRQLAFCCSGFNGGWSQTGLDVLDVTDKQDIQLLARVFYPLPGYSHQGWLSEDRRFFFLGDELDEGHSQPTTTVHVIDVSDPRYPAWHDSFTNGNPAVGHNLYTRGDLLYAANYKSGLRVFDVSDPERAWEAAWFDTFPEGDGADFNGLWSCYPYFPSGTVIGSDRVRGLFVWSVRGAPLAVTLPEGPPELLDPMAQTLRVRIEEVNGGALGTQSPALHLDAGEGWTSLPLADLGGGEYEASFPPLPCHAEVRWYVAAESSEGATVTAPGPGAGDPYVTRVARGGGVHILLDMEDDAPGWISGVTDDDATSGHWVHVDPIGTLAQPEDDHSKPGRFCWVTGQGTPGGIAEEADVDGGKTTLLSPELDLSPYTDPRISYWRWYDNRLGIANGEGQLEVDLSWDGGASWVAVERVGPGGPQAAGGWFRHELRVLDLAPSGAQVRLRFVAHDYGENTTVEAAIDDLAVADYDCPDCNGNGTPDDVELAAGAPDSNGNGILDECECETRVYCQALPNSTGLVSGLYASGSLFVGDDDLLLRADSLPAMQFGVFFYGATQAELPFGHGKLCLSGQVFRLPPAPIDPLGGALAPVDLAHPPEPAGQITPASTWSFQFWYRDPAAGGAAFNLSDGLEITFCP